jgi:hypothetical protein
MFIFGVKMFVFEVKMFIFDNLTKFIWVKNYTKTHKK